jgi:hypothetical protein
MTERRSTPYDGHDHDWQEWKLEGHEVDLAVGVDALVMAPCTLCGMTALEGLQGVVEAAEDAQAREVEARRALAELVLRDDMTLFHWSPTRRRKQIIRHGLRPGQRPTVSSIDPADDLNADWRAPVVCYADSPSWAWGLSGDMPWTEGGSWDLWQTYVSCLEDPIVMPDHPGPKQRPSGIYEVRTTHTVRKRDLWLVGSRVKG